MKKTWKKKRHELRGRLQTTLQKPAKFNKMLAGKVRESLASVLPITIAVLLLSFTISPVPMGMLGLFFLGAVLLIVGTGLFSLGADTAMMPMGAYMGARLTKMKKLPLLLLVTLLLGMLITVAEPDLAVLAQSVPGVPNAVLILTVALGVGLFLVLALLRIVFQKRLSYLLVACYIGVFALAAFTNQDFLAVAFDSGGVTTGPITVPFILALGMGVANVRSGKSAQDDSFGLVALCSVGPILAVMLLSLFYPVSGGEASTITLADPYDTAAALALFFDAFPHYFGEVALALSPIVALFLVFQFTMLRLPKREMLRMTVGVAYTYLGLTLFLTGVNVGFMPAGYYLGGRIAALPMRWVIVPIGMVIGYFIVAAEPAVHVLNAQVETITSGGISKRAMMLSLSVGVAVSIGLAMVRVLTGLSIWYFIAPGYALALALSFFTPSIFTAIAFDSGGVASGPMTATFLLPFAMGACEAAGGNLMTDAFGIVAMVAMTPLITIQILGLVYRVKSKKTAILPTPVETDVDDEIIDV